MNLSILYDAVFHYYSLLPYIYGRGRAFLPLRVQIEVTGRCNLKCAFCFQGEDYKQKEELPLIQIKSIIDQMPRRTLITFSGGEPLFRKDIYEIIDYALQKKYLCNISTNGVLLDEKMACLFVDKGLLVVSVSVDGIGQAHDALRGVPNTFSRVKENLLRLARIKKERKSKFPLLDLKMVITDQNISEITKVYSFCQEIGADFFTLSLLKANNVQFNPSALRGSLEDPSFYFCGRSLNLDKERLREELEHLERMQGKTRIRFYPRFGSLKKLRGFLARESGKPETAPCLEPWSSFQISASGEAYPCLSYNLGNIKDHSLREIWGSSFFNSFRKRLREIKLFPACSGCCYLKIKE